MRRLVVLLCLYAASSLHATPVDPANFAETVYVSNAAIGSMTGIAWAPDGSNRLFVTRKGGFSGQQTAEIRVVQNGSVLATPFATESVWTSSECGILGVAFDPDFINNRYVYFFLTSSSSQQKIVRYTDTNSAGTNRTEIVTGLPTNGANHDGGGLGIGNDGHLYWAVGDLGNGTGVDGDLLSLASKVGRVNRFTGAAVPDNPFVGQGNANTDKIWSRGYRNPFTLTFQVATGQLWVNSVGTNWEQVFTPQRGSHAGWNDFENNQPTGFIPPVIAYRTNGTIQRTITTNGAVRSNGIVTITTTSAHQQRKGGQVTITGAGSFNGTFFIASVLPGPTDSQISTRFTYSQAGPDETISGGTVTSQNIGGVVTGGTFYDSTAFPAPYHGNFFFGEYNASKVIRVPLDAANTPIRVEEFAVAVGSQVDMAVGPDGALYIANQSSPGTIRRLAYTGTAQNVIVFPTAFNVQEGGSSVVSIRLAQAPASDVTVMTTRLNGDADFAVSSGGTLTFTPANFATPQLVTVAGAEDGDNQNDAAVFRVSAPGIAEYDLTANGIDNDAVALTVQSAVSRREHGAEIFDIPLPLTGTPGVECRFSGTTGDYELVVTFSSPVSVQGTPQAQVVEGTGDIGSGGVSNNGMVDVSGAVVTIPLTNVANAQTLRVALSGVNAGFGPSDFVIPLSVLAGDVNASGAVNATDIALAKSTSGSTASAQNFRADVIATGSINSSDVGAVKAASGNVLPAAPADEKRTSRH